MQARTLLDRSNVVSSGRASTDSLVATLDALGVPVSAGADVDELIRAHARERADRSLEPVVVQGTSGGLTSPLVIEASTDLTRARITVTGEDGAVVRFELSNVVS